MARMTTVFMIMMLHLLKRGVLEFTKAMRQPVLFSLMDIKLKICLARLLSVWVLGLEPSSLTAIGTHQTCLGFTLVYLEHRRLYICT